MKRIIIAVLMTVSLFAQVSEKIEVPFVAFPIKMGTGFDAVQANCLTCHSFGYIINQGRQSKAFWREKVDKMIIHFKAPMDEAAAVAVTNYLYDYYGNDKLK
jgi:mono/diheme cytochrome c family protein